MSSLSFETTNIPELDDFLFILEQASEYAHNSTRWDELTWYPPVGHKGNTPLDTVEISLDRLVVYLKKHQKLIAKLKRQGFIVED